MVWSRSGRRENVVGAAGVPRHLTQDRRTPEVAFFVDDGGSSKIELLPADVVAASDRTCYAKGVQTVRLTSIFR